VPHSQPRRIHRRDFLKTGALALAALSLPACMRGLPTEVAPETGPGVARGAGAVALDEPFLFATGFENSYPQLPGGRRVDELAKTGHYERWAEDFAKLHEIGVNAVRYGPAWYRTHPGPGRFDWSSVEAPMGWLRDSGVTVIADLCHFGVPGWMGGFDDPAFPAALAEYAGAFARQHPWVRYYTPINEIFVAASFSALFGWWNEGRTGDAAFARTLLNLCRAHELAVEAILAERPDAIIVQTESCGRYAPGDASAEARSRAAFWSEMRFAALDLTTGRAPTPLVRELLAQGGMTEADAVFFARRRAAGQRWLGVDYYAGNEQVVAADGACTPAPRRAGLAAIGREYHARYDLPLCVTETNTVAAGALGWLSEQWSETLALRDAGVPVTGFTWFGLTDFVDWSHVLREERGDVDPVGLYDLERRMRPVGRAYQDLIAAWAPRLGAAMVARAA
jgi:beta-glucosidase/6-phospho-beta-glucosidase/beta-galactosidase